MAWLDVQLGDFPTSSKVIKPNNCIPTTLFSDGLPTGSGPHSSYRHDHVRQGGDADGMVPGDTIGFTECPSFIGCCLQFKQVGMHLSDSTPLLGYIWEGMQCEMVGLPKNMLLLQQPLVIGLLVTI